MAPARRSATRLLALLASIALFAAASPTFAQDLGGALDLGQLGADIGVNRAIRSQLSRPGPTRPGLSPRDTAGSTGATMARLTYTPSMALRRRNLAQFVAASRRRDPEGAARLEATLASRDLIGEINRRMVGYGFRQNDVADAYAAWWLNAWLASRGRTDDATPRQISAVRAQAAAALSALPPMRTATDAVKQEVAEAYLLQTALIGSHLERSAGDPVQMRRVSAAVREGARAAGLDLAGMELTDTGFVLAR